MKRTNVFFVYIFFIVLLLYNCNENHGDSTLNLIAITLKKVHSSLKKYDVILIIPNEGCNGCIKEATQYVIDNNQSINQETTAIVFTGIDDMKLFKLHVDNNLLSNKNVFIDNSNYFMNSKFSSMYPQTILLNNEKVISKNLFDRSIFKKFLNK